LPTFAPSYFLQEEPARLKKKDIIEASLDSPELLSHKFERLL